MDIDMSLDEIIERKRGQRGYRPIDRKFNANFSKPRQLLNKPFFKPSVARGSHSDPPAKRTFDARNKIAAKTRAKIADARDLINKSVRDSGIDARQLLERKKVRSAAPILFDAEEESFEPSHRARGKGVHIGQFGYRLISMSNHADGTIQAKWDSDDDVVGLGNHMLSGLRRTFDPMSNKPGQPFAPRRYIDLDNMQDLEDEEISRTLHLGQRKQALPHYSTGGLDLNRGNDVEMSMAPLNNKIDTNPFSIYEAARNRIERPLLTTRLVVGRADTTNEPLERRHRDTANTSKLPESVRSRLFVSKKDPRISHGIYANENRRRAVGRGGGSDSDSGSDGDGNAAAPSKNKRRSPSPLSLGTSTSKGGYRLLVSNLHTNVTTADIRELFSDIGPVYDARVVRPGTAEVIYKLLEHAEKAVDTYHHRQFDDQPMHCVLVNRHSSRRSVHKASSRTVTTNSSGVEVDIDALHSVLFRDR
ncbi:uncharacterized protein LOC6614906 [Drosophila sechellia]|uniref:uncharacterized protein LOC6614906 n=1 Tax=Drosophila sechellia TaxID=7238 RepID=UPI0013DD9C25|nr:uncharacterized protein LOC6614906 [Drosophila sechellia]